MTVRHALKTLFVFIALAAALAAGRVDADENVIVLCYHDVPREVNLDNYGVDQSSFINTIEYFKSHGYTFISLEDLLRSREGKKDLPPKSIMLTFDDAYLTYYTFVYPMLSEYKIPSTLAVVSAWIEAEQPPEYTKLPLMNWAQIQEVDKSKFVDVISHSHDLHKGIRVNPQKNKPAAATNRLYDEATQTYETDEAYAQRIRNDLETSQRILTQRLGHAVDAIAWPYGMYNAVTADIAAKAGFRYQFTLSEKAVSENRLGQLDRFVVYHNPTIEALLRDVKLKPDFIPQKRIVQMDLDLIYDEDPAQTEKNLGALLDRIKDLRVTTVYLQAFSDIDATGNIKEVYFPNRVLPMKMDLFSRVLLQLKARTEVEVYAWMPMLSFEPPDVPAGDIYVRPYSDEETPPARYSKRLSPFSPKAQEMISRLYEDLAINAFIDGIVFEDDAYLNEDEDFQADALKEYMKISGGKKVAPYELTVDQKVAWTQRKTKALNDLAGHLQETVEKYRPEVSFARTLYAPVLLDPSNQRKFAQSYQKSLELFDYAVIMAYPYMEGVKAKERPEWLAKLVEQAKRNPEGIAKTVFDVQAYDWNRKRWIKTRELNQWFSKLVSSGARHIAYYPDDYHLNNPRAKIIRDMMSVENFPFKRDWK